MEVFIIIVLALVLGPTLVDLLLGLIGVAVALVVLAAALPWMVVEWVIGLFRKKEDRSKWVWLDGPNAK